MLRYICMSLNHEATLYTARSSIMLIPEVLQVPSPVAGGVSVKTPELDIDMHHDLSVFFHITV